MSEKIAVHCKTEEEWKAVQVKSLTNGLTWSGGRKTVRPLSECVHSVPNLYICLNTILTACSSGLGYTIISAQDYLKEEEFKVGDRVECIKAGCNNKLVVGKIYIVSRGVDDGQIKIVGAEFEAWAPTVDKFKLATNKPTTTKEEAHDHISDALTYGIGITQVNIKGIWMEETMRKAIEDNFEKTKDANLVEAELGGSRLTEFVNDHLVKIYSKEILVEAKRLKKEREDEK